MTEETQIRAALAEWQQAFCRKDADALMALYAPDAVSFDAIPPFSESPEALREKIVNCLPYFPESFAIESRDLRLHLGGELASAHFLWHFIDLPPNHPHLAGSAAGGQHAHAFVIDDEHQRWPR